MNSFFEGLAQQKLPALGRTDVTVGAQHDVVGGQRISCDKKAEIALDQSPLIVGEAARRFPERDIAAHVDFLRHPVIGAGGQILFPGPLVLKGHQLIDVGATVDDALVFDAHTARTLSGQRTGTAARGGLVS